MLHRYGASEIEGAAALLKAGGVLAYPTEAVFGLGCDPQNLAACERVFALKQRPAGQGVLLIGADFAQLEPYLALDQVPEERLAAAHASWPGPHTWVFPRSAAVPPWIPGSHEGIGVRVTAHEPAAALCRAFGGALVSTSANPHGQPAASTPQEVIAYFGDGPDGLLLAPVGAAAAPTAVRDVLTGAIIRH
ncbi:MAG: Sua5/YciO/YrdC/YwlC family protein [Xanthomonadaceae bacterium]|nr:Sua5/YciO/YrdC/YwlC family protein [Xanthomonadaceae bacterium]MDE1964563.1 Sua5/YciO/YrdC/YwlC family protein [Xanthomonadaceae bacterium]